MIFLYFRLSMSCVYILLWFAAHTCYILWYYYYYDDTTWLFILADYIFTLYLYIHIYLFKHTYILYITANDRLRCACLIFHLIFLRFLLFTGFIYLFIFSQTFSYFSIFFFLFFFSYYYILIWFDVAAAAAPIRLWMS